MNTTLDVALFQLFPYVAVVIFFVESIRRYRQIRFSFSSLSSQFLEGDQLFIGTVPFHYGVIMVLAGHLIAFLFPRQLLAWNSVPIRLYIVEITGLMGGLSCLVGLVGLIVRRLRFARIRAVTSPMDVIILTVLAIQVSLGVTIALTLRWGSSWFAVALTPYLRSLIMLQPDLTILKPLPWVIKLHIFGMFLFLLLLSYSRLVHLLVIPWQYLWRPPQLVIWNRCSTGGLPVEVGARCPYAGVPAASTCMNCHSQIEKDDAEVRKIATALQSRRPIAWVRVHDLPDFTRFDHSAHVNKGVSCQTCHGPVENMARIEQRQPLTMGWCVQCHREYTAHPPKGMTHVRASTECSACHY